MFAIKALQKRPYPSDDSQTKVTLLKLSTNLELNQIPVILMCWLQPDSTPACPCDSVKHREV